jgi:hypothetical protein
LGWKPNDFDLFTWSEFYNAWKGHDKVMQQHWQMARQVGYYFVAMNQGKQNIIKKPLDLFELEIDRIAKKNAPKREVKVAKVRRVGDGEN